MSNHALANTQKQATIRLSPAASGFLQRKCACGTHTLSGECEECKSKKGMLQRASLFTRGRGIDGEGQVPPIVHDVLRSPGQPLDAATRAFMERRFGHDFGQVRVHTDAKAAESAQAVNALAYTVGRDVVFGTGQYSPGTGAGRHLIAHELTHAVQQRNATYPVGGLKLADATWEHEANAAAVSAMAGRLAQVAQHAAGAQLARQKFHTDTLKAPKDAVGKWVEVTRTVKPGKCAEVPETRTDSNSEITLTHAAIELSYCRGRTSASAQGEIDYSDVTNTIKQAVSSAPNFLSNPNRQALSNLEQAFKRVAPRANVRFDLQVGGTEVEVTGTGKASAEGGVSATAGATVSRGSKKVGVEVSRGTQEGTKVIVTGTLGGRAPEIPNCFKCECKNPEITFACVVHEPETPTQPPPQSRQIQYVPLFFEYQQTVPRKGWEKDYNKALDSIIERIREGYTIARIEGRTSPEGPLKGGPGFEGGNIGLAKGRAVQALQDLQAALDRAIGEEELKIRDRNPDTIRRLNAARKATYDPQGTAPGGEPASAELFGTRGKEEVSEQGMLEHLKTTLKAPEKGKPDPLAEEHVIGEGLPSDIRSEVEAEVEVFRTGKRGGKTLKDRELLETIYRPLRRALIVLNPPQPKPFSIQRPREEIAKIVGKPMDQCLPEHEALFLGKTIPNDWLYEGECRPKGGVGGKVE